MFEAWHRNCIEKLGAIPTDGLTDSQATFFNVAYRANAPVMERFVWPALDWTLDRLCARVGNPMIQVQTGRVHDPHYETRSYMHRTAMPFWRFVRMVTVDCIPNDIYMTAQNKEYNARALEPLWRDVGPLPDYLHQNPSDGFVWCGYKTVTPLHHDETNNVMFQVIGEKRVRMVAPSEVAKLSPRSDGVHSEIGWLADEIIKERNIVTAQDIYLKPGDSLFIPIGWWHCVDTFGTSLSLTYTNFIWPNFFGRVGEFQ